MREPKIMRQNLRFRKSDYTRIMNFCKRHGDPIIMRVPSFDFTGSIDGGGVDVLIRMASGDRLNRRMWQVNRETVVD